MRRSGATARQALQQLPGWGVKRLLFSDPEYFDLALEARLFAAPSAYIPPSTGMLHGGARDALAGLVHGGQHRVAHLTTTLVQAAVAASKKKGSHLKEKYWRLKARRGPERAALAIGHRILVAVYYMLSRSVEYCDLGAAYLDRAAATASKRNLVDRLKRLGYRVHLEPVAATG